ncbi:flagellar biosynthetic protein FliO [Euzebya sp.]|uniref:flagellar biosynthetic protein FliO n=1 Tax=Euzebya sp. TaxID=1971409 RepID=UPI003513EE11
MPDVSLAAMALRLAISMGVVVGLMLLAAKLLRRAQAAAASSGAKRGRAAVVRTPIDVASLAPLTRGASVAIVRAAGRELVLGVTETQVTLLHSGIETRAVDEDRAAELDLTRIALDLDGPDARLDSDEATSVAGIGAARIAASIPDLGGMPGERGQSAWTEALETLRARTVRR